MHVPRRTHGDFCAIDFGTSNSAVALASSEPGLDSITLVPLEGEQLTIPSAVFYSSEDGSRHYGRAAIEAYIDGQPGRLMRSLKSILGSALIEETTHLGDGLSLRYIDVIGGFLKHLKQRAEAYAGHALERVVLGRPVYFVDDDAAADARAEQALRNAALAIGFREVRFQYEPIAAARDYARRLSRTRLVLVADIGGGTSDFTLIRIGGAKVMQSQSDVLASHGVHVAGTDFDQRVELAAILPLCGFRARTPEGREVPNRIYYDLATWHLINSVYAPKRLAELQSMRYFYANPLHHQRLMRVVTQRLGHQLMARAEQAKIASSEHDEVQLLLPELEADLCTTLDRMSLLQALDGPLESIVNAARETVRRAHSTQAAIDALYLTGGSTGLGMLAERLAQAFPAAELAAGDRFSSVASGLGVEALEVYG